MLLGNCDEYYYFYSEQRAYLFSLIIQPFNNLTMNNGTFDFNLFLKESKETLLNPKSYFTTMKSAGGFIEPLIKAVIYGFITGVIYLFWFILGWGSIAGRMFGGDSGMLIIIRQIIGSGIGLFVGAVILLVLSSVCKGNTDFETNLRVSASLMVVIPISALFTVFSGLNLYLGFGLNLIVFIYSLWLLYNGLVTALRGKSEPARIVCYVLTVVMIVFLLLVLREQVKLEKTFNIFNKNANELLKDSKKK